MIHINIIKIKCLWKLTRSKQFYVSSFIQFLDILFNKLLLLYKSIYIFYWIIKIKDNMDTMNNQNLIILLLLILIWALSNFVTFVCIALVVLMLKMANPSTPTNTNTISNSRSDYDSIPKSPVDHDYKNDNKVSTRRPSRLSYRISTEEGG